MKVYELIQELAQYEADREIDFCIDMDVDVDADVDLNGEDRQEVTVNIVDTVDFDDTDYSNYTKKVSINLTK